MCDITFHAKGFYDACRREIDRGIVRLGPWKDVFVYIMLMVPGDVLKHIIYIFIHSPIKGPRAACTILAIKFFFKYMITFTYL